MRNKCSEGSISTTGIQQSFKTTGGAAKILHGLDGDKVTRWNRFGHRAQCKLPRAYQTIIPSLKWTV